MIVQKNRLSPGGGTWGHQSRESRRFCANSEGSCCTATAVGKVFSASFNLDFAFGKMAGDLRFRSLCPVRKRYYTWRGLGCGENAGRLGNDAFEMVSELRALAGCWIPGGVSRAADLQPSGDGIISAYSAVGGRLESVGQHGFTKLGKVVPWQLDQAETIGVFRGWRC
mgnify:CR=1 FL=1